MKHDWKRTVQELSQGIHVDMNLAQYLSHMMTFSHRAAGLKMAFQYPLLFETMKENVLSRELEEEVEELRNIIQEYLLGEFDGEAMEEGIKRIDMLRERLISDVQALTGFSDCFSLYEYVLNRMEYRFRDSSHLSVKEDSPFAGELLSFVLKGQDAQMKNIRIQEILAQLPVRMTRNKFYHLLEDALSLYQGADRKSVDDFLYMLRTSCLLIGQENSLRDSRLVEIREELSGADYAGLKAADYERLSGLLKIGADLVNSLTDQYLLLTEVVNSSYVLLLSRPYAMVEAAERDHCAAVIEAVQNAFSEDSRVLDEEELEPHFQALEGRQEYLAEQYEQSIGILSSLEKKYGRLMEGLMLAPMFASMKRISILMSGNYFASFAPEETGEADRGYLDLCLQSLQRQFDGAFSKNPKCVQRAIIAAALGLLPVPFQNAEEIKAYFEGSLASCQDTAEKAACIEILQKLMVDAYEMV